MRGARRHDDQVDGQLEKRFPRKYRTRYAMVAYSLVPYRVALEAGPLQETLLTRLCAKISRPEDVDYGQAEKFIDETLVPFWKARGVSWS